MYDQPLRFVTYTLDDGIKDLTALIPNLRKVYLFCASAGAANLYYNDGEGGADVVVGRVDVAIIANLHFSPPLPHVGTDVSEDAIGDGPGTLFSKGGSAAATYTIGYRSQEDN